MGSVISLKVSDMIGVTSQLRRYFIFVAMISIVFVTIISNVSIRFLFSDYIKDTRIKDDLKIVQYVEQLYYDNDGLGPQSLMNIMHYALSEGVSVRLIDMQDAIVWQSSTDNMSMMGNREEYTANLVYKQYPFNNKGKQIGHIEVGRSESIFSSLEDQQFLSTINSVFAVAFIFSIIIALLSSMHIAKKFLLPIFLLKENAKFIENGKYKNLNQIKTKTSELHDLSVSVQELAEKLEYQDTFRKRLTSDIAHELRTPLATLQSHVEAFMDGVWEPNIDKLSIIHGEITRLTKLIKDLSDLSIIESDEIKLNTSRVELSELLNNIIESFEPLYLNRNINLKKEIEDDIVITGDTDRLNQIFINLLSNAYKYTNEKGITFITLKKLKNTIQITVEDTGIGIPEDDIKHIFERFYRSDISRNRDSGGAGIGLTITKALVEAHGGNIWVKSKEGEGTKVIIEF